MPSRLMEIFLLLSNGYMPNINMKILKLCDLVLIRLPSCLGEKIFQRKKIGAGSRPANVGYTDRFLVTAGLIRTRWVVYQL